MQKVKETGFTKKEENQKKFGEESEEKEAYPIGGVWPSPFSTRFLLCCSLDIIIFTFINPPSLVLFIKHLADENLAPLNNTRKHKASFPIMDNVNLQLEDEY